DGDGGAGLVGAATEVGGVDDGAPGRVQLGDEGVLAASVGCLEGAGGDGEVGGEGDAGDVGTAGAVDGHASGLVPEAAAAQVGGVDEGATPGVDLRDEAVSDAGEAGLE